MRQPILSGFSCLDQLDRDKPVTVFQLTQRLTDLVFLAHGAKRLDLSNRNGRRRSYLWHEALLTAESKLV
jgi:hypothetical protein